MSKRTRLRWNKGELWANLGVAIACLGILGWMFYSIPGGQ